MADAEDGPVAVQSAEDGVVVDVPAVALPLALRHEPLHRAVVGSNLEVSVVVDGPEGTEVVLRWADAAGGDERRATMQPSGGGRFAASIAVEPRYATGLRYWVTADNDACEPKSVSSGSRTRPHLVNVDGG